MNKAAEVREALLKLPDVIDAFADGTTIIHMKAPGKLDEAMLEKALKGTKVQLKGRR